MTKITIHVCDTSNPKMILVYLKKTTDKNSPFEETSHGISSKKYNKPCNPYYPVFRKNSDDYERI